jgi:hypothetical protein
MEDERGEAKPVWRPSVHRRTLHAFRRKGVNNGGRGLCPGRPMTFCVLILLVSWIMVSAPAWAQTVKPGDTVTVDGVLTLSRGVDERKLEVVYPAVRLRRPLVVNDGSGDWIEVTLLKLRMNRQQEPVFRRLNGRQARVSGKLLYFEFGPNRFPNPAHLEVSTMTAR